MGKNVRVPSALQIISFGIAMVLTLIYAWATFAFPKRSSTSATGDLFLPNEEIAKAATPAIVVVTTADRLGNVLPEDPARRAKDR
jgi:hypothetical protein